MMQEKATIDDKVYLLVVSSSPDPNGTSCIGCAFDHWNEKDGAGCAAVVGDTMPTCKGNNIFIRDTPNAIAEWVNARIS
jgi:hypothetical protein